MKTLLLKTSLCCAFALGLGLCADASPAVDDALKAIRAVGPEGRGNAEASGAWKTLGEAGAAELPAILAAMKDANDLSANWLRSAVESIASRSAGKLPAEGLGRFLLDARQDPRARRLAYELLATVDPAITAKLLPGMLNDPSLEIRYDAVAKSIAEAKLVADAGQKTGAALLYQQTLQYARDVEQIEAITKSLKTLGQKVNLPDLFGFLMQWKVVGPFDNTKGAGFDTVFPPEQKLDFAAQYEGTTGPIRWQDYTSTHDYGMVDLNKPCGALKGVTAYATTDFISDRAQPAELRLGGKNGWKVWFNGKFLFGRDEYHRGAEIDQYRMPVQLQAGRNTILVKVCQNEQVEKWTVEWEFQLRVCDALGTAIHSTDRPPAPSTPTLSAN